jgi:hypothetical protein
MRFELIGGGGFRTSFQDPLNVIDPNSSTGLGKDWFQGVKVNLPNTGAGVNMAVATIGVTNFDGANGLVWAYAGQTGAAESYRTQLIPIKEGLYSGLYGKTQYAQITFLQATGTSWSPTVACCMYPSDEGWTEYHVRFNQGVATTWILQRYVASSGVNLASGTDTLNGNDVMRLSADLSVSGQVTLTFKKNGTVLATYVDTAAARIVIGVPGLSCGLPGSTGNAEMRTFSCGLGT